MSTFADWLMHTWTMFVCAWTLIEVRDLKHTLIEERNDMHRSRAAEPPHSSADASTPRQAWMTDEQARRYGDGA